MTGAPHAAVLDELDTILPVLTRLHARAVSAAGRAEATRKKVEPTDVHAVSRVGRRTGVHTPAEELPRRVTHAAIVLPTRRDHGPDVREEILQTLALVGLAVKDATTDKARTETLADLAQDLLESAATLHDTHHVLAALDDDQLDLPGARDATRVIVTRLPEPEQPADRTLTQVSLFLDEQGRSLCRSELVLADRSGWCPARWTRLRDDDDATPADMVDEAFAELDVR